MLESMLTFRTGLLKPVEVAAGLQCCWLFSTGTLAGSTGERLG